MAAEGLAFLGFLLCVFSGHAGNTSFLVHNAFPPLTSFHQRNTFICYNSFVVYNAFTGNT